VIRESKRGAVSTTTTLSETSEISLSRRGRSRLEAGGTPASEKPEFADRSLEHAVSAGHHGDVRPRRCYGDAYCHLKAFKAKGIRDLPGELLSDKRNRCGRRQ
jgi:hypothetical protein